MSFDTESFGVELVQSLTATLKEGWLHELQTGEPVAPEQYAQTCFAVAALRAGALTGDARLTEAGTAALEAYASVPEEQRGHGEFNSFAVSQLFRDSANERYELPLSADRLTKLIHYESGLRTQQGNNWLLLRAVSELELAELGVRASSTLVPLWLSVARRWVQADGTIVDQPRFSVAPAETPLTYHAKLTYLASILARHCSGWEEIALRGAKSLHRACLPDGESLYFGRSENTIFGYACLLGACGILISQGNSNRWLRELADRTAGFLATRFDPSEPSALPQYGTVRGEAIDDYVSDTVYTAYAAMVLLDCPAVKRDRGRERTNGTLDDVGISVRDGTDTAIGLATHGQYKLTKGRPDPRYAGMIPHALSLNGNPVLPGMPHVAWESNKLPFLPAIRINKAWYTPIIWNSLASTEDTLRGAGVFVPLPKGDTSRDNGSSSGLSDSVKGLARRTFLPLVRDRYQKRPAAVDASAQRAVHYLSAIDTLIIQTEVKTDRGTVIPSSYVLREGFRDVGVLQTNPPTKTSTEQITGHRGPGSWVSAERPIEGSTRSVILLDPTNKLDGHNTSFQDGIRTTLYSGDDNYAVSLYERDAD